MEWLLTSVLKLIASITTITGLAITATLFMVLILGGMLLYRVFAKSSKWLSASAQKNASLAE